jgi:UDP-glucose 4-epimerase
MKNNRVGIFGGSGYVGSKIADHLKDKFNIEIFDVKKPSVNMPNVSFRQCDIREPAQVDNCTRDLDFIINTAIIQIPMISEQRRLGYEVNYIGTQNICEAVHKNPRIKGMILAGSWHTMGERGLRGLIDEEFGFRPDKVEERARLYAFSEMSDKIFGIIRMGTVLGEGMSEKTAANIFIDRSLKGLTITPFKHSMHRPMLYVDIRDICKAYELFVTKVLNNDLVKTQNSLDHIVNVYYPEPITILDLAKIVQETIMHETSDTVKPVIDIVDANQPIMFTEEDKIKIKVDISKARSFLGLDNLTSPRKSIENIVKNRLAEQRSANHQ